MQNIKKLGKFREDSYKFLNFVQFNVINEISRHFFGQKIPLTESQLGEKITLICLLSIPEKERCRLPQTSSFEKANT